MGVGRHVAPPVPPPTATPTADSPVDLPTSTAWTPAPQSSAPNQRQAHRQQRYATIQALLALGSEQRAIAAHLGHATTVSRQPRRFPDAVPERVLRQIVLDPYLPYLLRQWEEGCTRPWSQGLVGRHDSSLEAGEESHVRARQAGFTRLADAVDRASCANIGGDACLITKRPHAPVRSSSPHGSLSSSLPLLNLGVGDNLFAHCKVLDEFRTPLHLY